jgi:threonyl-tRNA synthetase
LRPMTCPHHFQYYASKPRSYKELPFRIAELAKQFRYEKSGELTGLIRVRSFCLADSHIICQKEQALSELNTVLDLIEYMAVTLGLNTGDNYRYRLSLGDRKEEKKYYKDDEAWDSAESILRSVLTGRRANFYEAGNEAAFYGPKIDIQMRNFAGKEDTVFTVQYDFVMPKRFKLTYIDNDGKEKEPIVIHRSSIGVGVRVQVDDSSERMNQKIRQAQLEKIPCMIIVGEKEVAESTVSVRLRTGKQLPALPLPQFRAQLIKIVAAKSRDFEL